MKVDGVGYGYADIFPWPEFGDPSTEQIPRDLISQRISPLLSQSLIMAATDALARAEGQSLLAGVQIKNHFLVMDVHQITSQTLENALRSGFTSFKFKLGSLGDAEAFKRVSEVLPSFVAVRLDFNTRGSLQILRELHQLDLNFQFVEDPFAQANLWSAEGWDFAYDQPPFSYSDVKTQWQVVKPARQSVDDIQAQKIVFTSSMDHPIGIAHGLLQAARFGPQTFDYGFLSQSIYEDTIFHSALHCEGPLLTVEPGQGIGFDTILASLQWQELA